MIITGTVTDIGVYKDDDWAVFTLEDKVGREYQCTGTIPGMSVNTKLTFEGEETMSRYGCQIKVTDILSEENDGLAGMRALLSMMKGIGPSTAANITDAFGDKSLDIIKEGNTLLLSGVKGMGRKRADTAIRSYRAKKESVSRVERLTLFLNGSATENQIRLIIDSFKDDSIRKIKKNPYCLTEIKGFGFRKADYIALHADTGIRQDSVKRITAGISHVISEAADRDGDCYLMRDDIRERTAAMLVPAPRHKGIKASDAEAALTDWDKAREKFIEKNDPPAEVLSAFDIAAENRDSINRCLTDALDRGISEGTLIDVSGRIYTKEMYDTERGVADMLLGMAGSAPVKTVSPGRIKDAVNTVTEQKNRGLPDGAARFEITEEQMDAVMLGLNHRLSVISGGPGRGKTAITAIISRAFGPEDVIMVAPTGRAAQRMKESTGHPARTIHAQVLAAKSGKEPYPRKKLIICDETSMVDIGLMRMLLVYAKDCSLILIGDADQLPSVGPGKALRDIIASGAIPCALLRKGHRNMGSIAKNAELINKGLGPGEYKYDPHFAYMKMRRDDIPDAAVKEYAKAADKYGIREVLLCTPMKWMVDRLNQGLQAVRTSGSDSIRDDFGHEYRVGDRVMHTKNNYEFTRITMRKGGGYDYSMGVMNGERGTAVKVIRHYGEEDKLEVQFDDGTFGIYSKATMSAQLTLAYATTVHKCQGSEAQCVIMPIFNSDYVLMNRSLLYTAETRAKDRFLVIGEVKDEDGKHKEILALAAGKADDRKRNTSLKEFLDGALPGEAAIGAAT